jgi:acyl carrier protein
MSAHADNEHMGAEAMPDVTAVLRKYILERHLQGELPANLTEETRLLSSGILDSMAVLELASFIEQEFGVELNASDTTFEAFDRLKDIVVLVEHRRSGVAGGAH